MHCFPLATSFLNSPFYAMHRRNDSVTLTVESYFAKVSKCQKRSENVTVFNFNTSMGNIISVYNIEIAIKISTCIKGIRVALRKLVGIYVCLSKGEGGGVKFK